MKPTEVWYLLYHGRRLHRGKSKHEVLRWLDSIQPHSRKHAMKYSGYSVIKVNEQICYRKKGCEV